MPIIHWTEITLLNNIRKYTLAHPEILNGNSKVTYSAKVKLHGTNSAIQSLNDGTIIPQSRTTLLTATEDNMGFAKWALDKNWETAKGMILFGEWAGPGVQKGVAISDLSKKVFVVFAARPLNDSDELIVDPTNLRILTEGVADTYVLPWFNSIEIDWSLPDAELQKSVDQINKWVEAVEQEDPWVKETFGVKGTGEGLVFYPTSKEHLGYKNFSNLVFKAKGEAHKNIKKAAPAQLDASVAAGIDQFVDMVLTDARLEQGARAILGEHKHEESLNCLFCTTGKLSFDLKNTGKFVNWIQEDVKKETKDELEASNLTFDQISKPLQMKARTWYLNKAKGI